MLPMVQELLTGRGERKESELALGINGKPQQEKGDEGWTEDAVKGTQQAPMIDERSSLLGILGQPPFVTVLKFLDAGELLNLKLVSPAIRDAVDDEVGSYLPRELATVMARWILNLEDRNVKCQFEYSHWFGGNIDNFHLPGTFGREEHMSRIFRKYLGIETFKLFELCHALSANGCNLEPSHIMWACLQSMGCIRRIENHSFVQVPKEDFRRIATGAAKVIAEYFSKWGDKIKTGVVHELSGHPYRHDLRSKMLQLIG